MNSDDILSTIKGDHAYQVDLDDIRVSKVESESVQRKIKCEEPTPIDQQPLEFVDSSKLASKSRANKRRKTQIAERTEESLVVQEADNAAIVEQQNDSTTVALEEKSVLAEQAPGSTKVPRSNKSKNVKTKRMPAIKAETTKKSRLPKKCGANKSKDPPKENTTSNPISPTISNAPETTTMIDNDCNSGIEATLHPYGMFSYFCYPIVCTQIMKIQYFF